MNTRQQVKQCRTTEEALLVLADAIDALAAQPQASPFEAELTWDEGAVVEAKLARIAELNDNRAVIQGDDVIVKPVSLARQEARLNFIQASRLAEFVPMLTEEQVQDAYVKGGPRWLYYTNREAVMAMPVNMRQALVADVLLDSAEEADEIGRDILKFSFDEGSREGEALDALRREYGPLA